jgi:hypothetical protein
MSDTVQQLWRSWEGQEPAFYELAYGAWSGWLVLYFGWSLLLRLVAPSLQVSPETWRLGLVHLLGASFYVGTDPTTGHFIFFFISSFIHKSQLILRYQ